MVQEMIGKSVWTQESTRHYTLSLADRRVDVRYEAAGFQSVWAICVGNRVVDRCKEFMQARGLALAMASR